jgi:beta-alanine--pyruvate transaminase
VHCAKPPFRNGERAWADCLSELRDANHVIDVRALGLVAGIELESRAGAPGARGHEVFVRCFENGLLVRVTGDLIALSPPLIVEADQFEAIVRTIADVLKRVD